MAKKILGGFWEVGLEYIYALDKPRAVLGQKEMLIGSFQTLYPIPRIALNNDLQGGQERGNGTPVALLRTRNRLVADLARQVSGWTETSTSVN